MESPKIEYLSIKEEEKLENDFPGQKQGWIFFDEKKWFLPRKYEKSFEKYYNFEVKPNDTWLVTYPRSGTTWSQETIWLIAHGMDFKTANSVSLQERFPYLEVELLLNESVCEEMIRKNETDSNFITSIQKGKISNIHIQNMPEPRFIETHLGLSLIPNVLKSGCKVFYIARNPKDVAVSYYHLQKNTDLFHFPGSFEEFWDYFQNNRVIYTPYWEHIKEGWAQRNNPNFMFIFYEDMIHDLLSVVKRIAKFLGKSYTEDQFKVVVEHLSFSSIKKNKMVNLSHGENTNPIFKTDIFVRQGKSQAWQNMFTPELNEKANRWIKENLKDTDLTFPHIDIYS